MRLRWRDIPLYLLGALCWVWAVLRLGGLVLLVVRAAATGDVRHLATPVLAGAPGLVGGWLVLRHFQRREIDESNAPGFEVLPPK